MKLLFFTTLLFSACGDVLDDLRDAYFRDSGYMLRDYEDIHFNKKCILKLKREVQ